MPIFFISSNDISGNEVRISGRLVDHLRGSLRYQAGDRISVTDERRRRYNLILKEIKRDLIISEILNQEEGKEPTLIIILGQCIIKGKRMDWLVQKATELGVARIIPIISERVVVKPDKEKIESYNTHWQEIAKEASQQSERWDVPVIEPISNFAFFLEKVNKDAINIICSERNNKKGLKEVIPGSGDKKEISLLIGPEGGFTENELSIAEEKGYVPVSLGDRILRTETAALSVISNIQYEYEYR